MTATRLFLWVVGGYLLLALAPLGIAVVCDYLLIPCMRWLHRVGVLKVKQ